ncbi:MAG TPA: uridine kinase [Caldilineaceae bacterium]|nr:uridine kinase [Caldilineaceae bacterium]
MNPFIIGVAGGSGSGKTTVSNYIQAAVGADEMVYLQHDSYYRDLSHLPFAERLQVNYDHPDSLETSLLVEHLIMLRNGYAIEAPRYDFTTYSRLAETQLIKPARVVVVEGILIFAEKSLREQLDMRIFVDADADLRFIRRLSRDINERGRTLESVVHQYLETVRPMHLEFVEPSKRYAHVIIPEGGENRVAMAMIVSRVQAILAQAG